MTCQDCGNWASGKKARCFECKRKVRGEKKGQGEKKPFIFTPSKSYLDILTDNMERQYPGKGKEKAAEVLKRSKLLNSFN